MNRQDNNPSADTIITKSAQSLNLSQRIERTHTLWDMDKLENNRSGSTCTLNSDLSETKISADSFRQTKTKIRNLVDEHELQGDFKLKHVIGRGGMALVYEAEQSGLNRNVAVKIQESGHNEKQFLAEAGVIAQLEHPNIVPIYDVGKDKNNSLFYAMRRISGISWRQRIDKQSISENVDVLLKVADAISHAHSRKILHCDLKPANIMLGSFGEVFVIDWGLAMAHTSQGAKTIIQDGHIGGTPPYMAPEQALSIPEQISPQTDIYLLCGLLFRICTGNRPHPGENNARCIENAAKNVLSPFEHSEMLIEIALKGLCDNPSDRWASVEILQEQLRNWKSQGAINQLIENAQHQLSLARRGQYRRFSKALFIAQEALKLQSEKGIPTSVNLISQIRLDYTRAAMDRGDLNLANSIIPKEQAPTLNSELQRTIKNQQLKQKRLTHFKIAISGMLLFICIASAGTALATTYRQHDSEKSYNENVRQQVIAQSQAMEQTYAIIDAEIQTKKFISARRRLESIDLPYRNDLWKSQFKKTFSAWTETRLANGGRPLQLHTNAQESVLVSQYGLHSAGAWSLPDLKLLYTIKPNGKRIHSVDISPNGNFIILKSTRQIAVYDTDNRTLLPLWDVIGHKGLKAIDNQHIVCDRKDALVCYNFLTREPQWEIPLLSTNHYADYIAFKNNTLIFKEGPWLFEITVSGSDEPKVKKTKIQNTTIATADYRGEHLVYYLSWPNGSCSPIDRGGKKSHYNSFLWRAEFGDFNMQKKIFAVGSDDIREVYVRPIYENTPPSIIKPPSPPSCLRFINNAKQLLIGSQDRITLIDIETVESDKIQEGHGIEF